jgi:hypothetical protein
VHRRVPPGLRLHLLAGVSDSGCVHTSPLSTTKPSRALPRPIGRPSPPEADAILATLRDWVREVRNEPDACTSTSALYVRAGYSSSSVCQSLSRSLEPVHEACRVTFSS